MMFDWFMDLIEATMRQLDDDLYKLETWIKRLFKRRNDEN